MICARPDKPVAMRALGVAMLGLGALAAPRVEAMTLTEALQRAQDHDPAVAVSLAQYQADRESGAADRAGRLPSVSVGGTYYYARTESDGVFGKSAEEYPDWGAQVIARQPLFRLDWFALGDRARALEARADIAHKDSRLELLRRVAERYFNVLLAQDQLAQAEAEAKAFGESLESTQKRYDVELVPGTDLREAQARDDLARARLLSAQTALQTARDALHEVTGNGYEPLPHLAESVAFPALSPNSVEAWVEAARQQNPRIALAREAAVVARANRSSARADASPRLDLVASAGHQDTGDFEFGQKSDDARVGVELNIPLYAGGANAARIRQAGYNLAAAEADLRRVTLETERSTRQLYREVENAYAAAEAFRKSLLSAQAAEAATAAGYDAGTRTITDVLDAKSRVVQARRDFNSTRYNLLLSLLQLKQLAGELDVKDFVQIDQLLSSSSSQQ